jgi:chaperonin GroES
MIASVAKPLFRRGLRASPGMPMGNFVLVRPFPAMGKTEGGLVIQDTAKERNMAGRLIMVGDEAADKLHDKGVEIGDEIWHARYAGNIEEWQHIVKDGRPADCPHDGQWDRIAKDDKAWALVPVMEAEDADLRSCRACRALKLAERVIVMSADDLAIDVDLMERLENGTMVRKRGVDGEGKTRYYIERTKKPGRDTFAIPREEG